MPNANKNKGDRAERANRVDAIDVGQAQIVGLEPLSDQTYERLMREMVWVYQSYKGSADAKREQK